MASFVALLGAAMLVAVLLILMSRPRGRARTSSVAELERRYLAEDGRSPAEARAALERHVRSLAERFPGKSRAWYLQRLLADARRARR